MAEMLVTKKSFIGGRIVYPGETVDVDARGDVAPAPSTPVGNLTIEQLRRALSAKETEGQPAPAFGANVAEPGSAQTGVAPVPVAPITVSGPGGSGQPQGVPSGTEQHQGAYLMPSPEAQDAAVQQLVAGQNDPATGELKPTTLVGEMAAGQTPGQAEPTQYDGMTKAELQAALDARGVAYESDANKARLLEIAKG